MNSIKEIKEIKEFYDEATYRKLHGFIYTNTRIEYAWQSLNSIFNFTNPKRILEIGSGIGEISYRLASKFNNVEVIGFDISDRSVNISKDLFILPNLSFVRADSITEITFPSKGKFDLIFMMDVYEHIPIEDRDMLHRFIKENISTDGFVFLSCPTPQHLDYLKKNYPDEIQPVDENISLKELTTLSDQSDLKLILYKEVSVWRGADYFHVILSNHLTMQPFSDFEPAGKVQVTGLKKEILKKVRKFIKNKNPDEEENLILEKKKLVQRMLGQAVLDRVEAFGK